MEALAFLRCLQLASPSLPIGAYAYSQGLETAVEAGWVRDQPALQRWLEVQLADALARVDLPLYARLHAAARDRDTIALERWSAVLLAHRETSELRSDDRQRGQALARLLRDLGLSSARHWTGHDAPLATLFAIAAVEWDIPLAAAAQAYAFGWLENQVLAGVKLIPLGQVAGQRTLLTLAAGIEAAVLHGLALTDTDVGGSLPALAIASARHETQYTRLFRS